MSWIQHCSKDAIRSGDHPFEVGNTVLIQILGEDEGQFLLSKFDFVQVDRFIFDDTNESDDLAGLSDTDALRLADVLIYAKANNHNVLVHCMAGVSRSSAVALVGQKIGFEWKDKKQPLPNRVVMHKLNVLLGIEDDSKETHERYLGSFINRIYGN